MKTVVAFLAAILAPAFAIGGYYAIGTLAASEPDDAYAWVRIRDFWLMVSYISAGHVILMGVPAFLLLRWKHLIRWRSSLGAGFVLGCIPAAVWTWPLKYPELKSLARYRDGEKWKS